MSPPTADTDFELKLAGADQRERVEFCWRLRDLVNELGITSGHVSPRTMIQGGQDLRDGLSREKVEGWLIWNNFLPPTAHRELGSPDRDAHHWKHCSPLRSTQLPS